MRFKTRSNSHFWGAKNGVLYQWTHNICLYLFSIQAVQTSIASIVPGDWRVPKQLYPWCRDKHVSSAPFTIFPTIWSCWGSALASISTKWTKLGSPWPWPNHCCSPRAGAHHAAARDTGAATCTEGRHREGPAGGHWRKRPGEATPLAFRSFTARQGRWIQLR